MTGILYEPTPVLVAVRDLLHAQVDVGGQAVRVELDDGEWAGPGIVVELVAGPVPTSIHWGGHDWAVLTVQVTCMTNVRDQARLLGGQCRLVLTALDRRGSLVHSLEGVNVLELTSNGDGAVSGDGRSWQHVERFQVRYTAH